MGNNGVRQCMRDTTPYLAFLMCAISLGPLLFGFHLGELNAPQDVITCKKDAVGPATAYYTPVTATASVSSLIPACIPMDEAQFAVISSMFTLGGLIGALSAGPLSTSRGRTLVMRLSAMLYLVGAIIETLAPSVFVFSTGRFISGLGAGASVVVVPIYISEIAPPAQRGLFGFLTQITTNLGILTTQILGYFLSAASLWRFILMVGAILAFILLMALVLVPESPAWTAQNQNPHRAIKVLQRIRGPGTDISEEIASWDVIIPSRATTPHLTEVTQGLLEQPASLSRRSSTSKSSSSSGSRASSQHIGFFEVVTDPLYRRAIIAVVGIMIVQQLSGINSVMMYSVSILSELFPSTATLLTILISVVNLLMTIAASPLPEVLGRKNSLILSASGLGVCSALLGVSILNHIPLLSAISIILFVAFFAVGLGPIPFLIASELVGTEAKGATQSWALSTNWIATFLVAQFFPILNGWVNEKLGGRGYMYFFFAAVAGLGVIFFGRFVPETKGKRDADEVWGRTRRVD